MDIVVIGLGRTGQIDAHRLQVQPFLVAVDPIFLLCVRKHAFQHAQDIDLVIGLFFQVRCLQDDDAVLFPALQRDLQFGRRFCQQSRKFRWRHLPLYASAAVVIVPDMVQRLPYGPASAGQVLERFQCDSAFFI